MVPYIRILKNPTKVWVNTNYNGKRYVIKPKGSIKLEQDGKDYKAADYLLQTYGFLTDITPKPDIKKLPIKTAQPN